MGDPLRALELEVILNEIEGKHLVENTAITGKYLLAGLEELQVPCYEGRKLLKYNLLPKQGKHSSLVSRARGVGTFCAFDLPTPQVRDKLIESLRQKGTLAVVCILVGVLNALLIQVSHRVEAETGQSACVLSSSSCPSMPTSSSPSWMAPSRNSKVNIAPQQHPLFACSVVSFKYILLAVILSFFIFCVIIIIMYINTSTNVMQRPPILKDLVSAFASS